MPARCLIVSYRLHARDRLPPCQRRSLFTRGRKSRTADSGMRGLTRPPLLTQDAPEPPVWIRELTGRGANTARGRLTRAIHRMIQHSLISAPTGQSAERVKQQRYSYSTWWFP